MGRSITQSQHDAEVARWTELGFKHEHRKADGAQKAFTAAIGAHRKQGHQGMSTFWDFRCACGTKASLMIWSGEPFIPNGRGRFAALIEDDGNLLITEDYPY